MTAQQPDSTLPGEVEDAVLRCFDRPSPERAAAIDALCQEWPQFATRIRAWVVTHGQTSAGAAESPLTVIGPYRLLEKIAEGGMGMVYAAEQAHPVRRRVAIKVIRPGMDSREVLARFEQERQALAMMNHPHIAKVLDAGETTTGRPYFAMELVAGLPITTFTDRNRLTMRERLELFAQVCDGVQHAHQKGVVHRDIKPSNILVTPHDGKPHAKIIDFGVAKATQQPLTEKTVYTFQGQMIGTPEYMSPEQAEMSGVPVDTRSDIYSLGVLLYELLTGSLPFDRQTFRSAGLQGMLKILREQEPEKPSTKVTTIGAAATELASRRRTEVGTLKRQLRGDLDWITIKALEKDPARRYQSAGELAGDVLRHLRDEPVLAGPPTFGYRLSKLMRRHKGPLIGAMAVFAALLVGLVVNLWLLAETRRAWAGEAAERRRAERAVEERDVALAKEKAARADATSLAANREAELRETQLYEQEMATVFSALVDPSGQAGILVDQADVDRRAERLRIMAQQFLTAGRDREVRELLFAAQSLPRHAPEALDKLRGWLGAASELRSRREAELAKLQSSQAPADRQRAMEKRKALDVLVPLVGGIEARARVAESIQDATLTRPADAWRKAAAAVAADPRYNGLNLTPRLGLIPLGPDPDSGLQEFALYGSGDPPTRGGDGRLVRTSDCSLVFVLIPPAQKTWLGAQKVAVDGPNYDPQAQPNEPSPSMANIAAFLISKFEITQAQWIALAESENPSRYLGDDNPVDFVDQSSFVRVLAWYDMQLPTEVEWEYACRAGTATPWYTGATRESLAEPSPAANIADVTLLERGAPRDRFEIWEEYRDGMPVHGRVGQLRPNKFGLHDMLGNVFELCILGEGPLAPDQLAVARGGAWNRSAGWARATARIEIPAAGTRFDNLGARPVIHLSR